VLDTGVIHQDIGAPPGRHSLHQLIDPIGVAQIAVEELRMGGTLVPQVVADLLDLRVSGQAMYRDPRTRFGQRFGDGEADPLHRPRHQRRFARQIGHGIPSLSRSRRAVFKTLP
jgi:hypothetical protein